MFIASIIPALFVCVLGTDDSVLTLAPKSTTFFPFIDIRKPQSVLREKLEIQKGSASTHCETGRYVVVYQLAPNTPFTLPFLGIPRPQSVFHGNVALREGSTSKPCELGEPCYQSLTDREYVFVGGSHNGGKGIIVAYPADETKSPSAIIVQTKGDTSSDPSIPVGVGVTERIELDTTVSAPALIWYADKVQNTNISENVEFLLGDFPPTNRYFYLAPYLHKDTKELPFLVLTGQLGRKKMEYKLVFSSSYCPVIRLVPGDAPDWFPTTIRVAFSGVLHLKPWKLLICLLPAIMTTAMP